jgi:hypothetical protein
VKVLKEISAAEADEGDGESCSYDEPAVRKTPILASAVCNVPRRGEPISKYLGPSSGVGDYERGFSSGRM